MASKTSIKSAKLDSPGELGDSKAASKIRFSATLLRPKSTAKAVSWTFLTLPKEASAKLPSRGMTTAEGTINGCPFRATLEPDGQKGHWLRVNRKLGEAAGAGAPVEGQVWLFGRLAGPELANPMRLQFTGDCALRDVIDELGRRLGPEFMRALVSESREVLNTCRVFLGGELARDMATPISGAATVEIILLREIEGG